MSDEKTSFTKEEVDALLAEQVGGLKANRDEALKELKAAKARLANYSDVDPEEYKSLKQAAAEAEQKKALAEGNLEAWKKQTVEQHQKELAAKEKEKQKALNALEKRKVSRLTEALAKADALPEFMELLTLKGSASVRLRETDDDWEEYVADQHGNPLVADGSGSPMTMEQFAAQTLKAQYPGAFKGTGSSGGGATKSTGGASGATRSIASTNSPDFLNNLADISAGKVKVG